MSWIYFPERNINVNKKGQRERYSIQNRGAFGSIWPNFARHQHIPALILITLFRDPDRDYPRNPSLNVVGSASLICDPDNSTRVLTRTFLHKSECVCDTRLERHRPCNASPNAHLLAAPLCKSVINFYIIQSPFSLELFERDFKRGALRLVTPSTNFMGCLWIQERDALST